MTQCLVKRLQGSREDGKSGSPEDGRCSAVFQNNAINLTGLNVKKSAHQTVPVRFSKLPVFNLTEIESPI